MEFETLRPKVDGVDTIVKAIGSGPSLLAFHGAATIEGYRLAEGLADRFRIHHQFHPGFGESATAPHIIGMQHVTPASQ
ncbi:hypothetical protein [Bradyrhizobium yuanmingense]|uniref:hypothetical protein n=1 Tax=Bradyrhizobium yuanmingense TaxID=108015 RepID=UPI0023B88E86|nr:hypothetical protein [Bradyrhizobium yuanmingense]MDF0520155.1 hypothetical protein [Bradyrhizobium yuanmingense]MDF0584207.1 hypothetical protein [Bradyrhizobium yuanmingense]